MTFISWNVNGLRAALKKGFLAFVERARPDVLCLQETKVARSGEPDILPAYRAVWHTAERPGYAGTALFTRLAPRAVRFGLGGSTVKDSEGRVIAAEFDDLFLVNCYTPNAQRGLTRLDYRVNTWDPAFLRYLKRLEREKPVVVCGDLNVAHKEIDLARPEANVKNAGFTPEERARFDRLIAAGFIDTFRALHPEATWWSYIGNARAKNIGWRIDYFLLSRALRARLKRSEILADVLGSDHCPILLELA